MRISSGHGMDHQGLQRVQTFMIATQKSNSSVLTPFREVLRKKHPPMVIGQRANVAQKSVVFFVKRMHLSQTMLQALKCFNSGKLR